jgi:hypothetical protein
MIVVGIKQVNRSLTLSIAHLALNNNQSIAHLALSYNHSLTVSIAHLE